MKKYFFKYFKNCDQKLLRIQLHSMFVKRDFLGHFQTLWSVYLNTIIKKVLLQVNALIIVQWKDAKRDSLAPTNYLATVACTRARKNSPAPCAADALSAPIT